MRLPGYQPPLHVASWPLPSDHHPAPEAVTITSTGTVSLPPGTLYNLDITLANQGHNLAHVALMGPQPMTGQSWREYAEITVTRSTGTAIGESHRDAGLARVYHATYHKSRAASYLSHKIFDSVLGASARYICLEDAVILDPGGGDVLRLSFRNLYGGSSYLWVEGKGIAR